MNTRLSFDVITKETIYEDVPDEPYIEPTSQPPTIDERVDAVETDVDDIITVLAVIEGVS